MISGKYLFFLMLALAAYGGFMYYLVSTADHKNTKAVYSVATTYLLDTAKQLCFASFSLNTVLVPLSACDVKP